MTRFPQNPHMQRALLSLEGLAVGDAFGARFFFFAPERYHRFFEDRQVPETTDGGWPILGARYWPAFLFLLSSRLVRVTCILNS